MIKVEALIELVDLARPASSDRRYCRQTSRGNRAAIWGAEQGVDEPERALPAVAAIAALGERAAARAVGEMAFGQRDLDGELTLQQPVPRGVELVLIDLAEAEHVTKARCGGVRGHCTGGGELGRWIEDPADSKARTRARSRQRPLMAGIVIHRRVCCGLGCRHLGRFLPGPIRTRLRDAAASR